MIAEKNVFQFRRKTVNDEADVMSSGSRDVTRLGLGGAQAPKRRRSPLKRRQE